MTFCVRTAILFSPTVYAQVNAQAGKLQVKFNLSPGEFSWGFVTLGFTPKPKHLQSKSRLLCNISKM